MKKVLVTGSNGFIGKHVLFSLKQRGYEVYALYNQVAPKETGIDTVKCNLFDFKRVDEVMSAIQPTYLLHLAWYTSHGKFWDAPENFTWVKASMHLLEQFITFGGKRALIAGSSCEYDWSKEKFSEQDLTCQPSSFYGKAKNCLRILSEEYAQLNSLSLAWGRIFFTHGPYEPERKIVASVISQLLKGLPASIQSGDLVRDYLYVLDMADALVHVLDSDIKGVVNIASGEAMSLRDIGQIIETFVGVKSLLQIGNSTSHPLIPISMIPDTDKLKNVLGWKPKFTVQEGLAESIKWWQEKIKQTS